MPEYKKTEDGKGIAIDGNGLPIVVKDDGTEQGIDAIHLMDKVPALNAEAKKYRLSAEEATTKLKAFEGIEDPASALKALETVKNLDAKQLIDANEAQKVREQAVAETKKAMEARLAEKDGSIEGLQGQVYKLMVSDRFNTSQEVKKTILPPDVAEAYFGKNFKVETKDGKQTVVGYLGDEPIYSKERPGELAGFDESLNIIIDKYPMKDHILAGEMKSGSGTPQHNKSRNKGSITRDAFMQKNPAEQMKYVQEGGVVTD